MEAEWSMFQHLSVSAFEPQCRCVVVWIMFKPGMAHSGVMFPALQVIGTGIRLDTRSKLLGGRLKALYLYCTYMQRGSYITLEQTDYMYVQST